MRGKYSPTVSAAYRYDQDWFEKYAGDAWYDREGFDAYGYNSEEIDRAGNHEHDYYPDDEYEGRNFKYEYALDNTIFDGEKPIYKG